MLKMGRRRDSEGRGGARRGHRPAVLNGAVLAMLIGGPDDDDDVVPGP